MKPAISNRKVPTAPFSCKRIKRVVVGVLLVLQVMGLRYPVGSADPTPPPGPYQIQTPAGPQIGGLRSLPPVCAVQPRACNLNWSPDTGTWNAPPPSE